MGNLFAHAVSVTAWAGEPAHPTTCLFDGSFEGAVE